jgi:hypothetical protein
MKAYKINREISNIGALRSQLIANGWAGASVLYCALPMQCVTVQVADAAPDPTAFVTAFVDPATISADSNKPDGPFGHSQGNADGVDFQTITIQMLDRLGGSPLNWNGSVLVQPQGPIQRSPAIVPVVNGVGTFTVGPTTIPGEYDLFLQIQGDTEGYSRYRLHLSFF